MTGTVKFYLREKGYGFIIADGRPDTDLFVHRGHIVCTHKLSEAVLNSTVRYPYLKQNERVRFVVSNDMGTIKAVNVTWLNGDAIPPERKNYLGGVYERSHRLFGEACMSIMKQKMDVSVPFSEEEYEKIRIAYIESKRSIEHAERILVELGMDVSTFPTIKGGTAARGKYLFQSEVDDENKKAIEKAIAAAHNVQPTSNLSLASIVANGTDNSITTEQDWDQTMGQTDGDDDRNAASVFDQEPLSEYADSEDDKHNDDTQYKR
jgi:cold shock CspA family protein